MTPLEKRSSMTEEIPAEIMKQAGGVVADIFDCNQLLFMGQIEAAALPVARALLAAKEQGRAEERERCAKIVDEGAELRRKRASEIGSDPDHSVALRMAHELEFIAAAIRST